MTRLMTLSDLTHRYHITTHYIKSLEDLLGAFYGSKDILEKQACRGYMVEGKFFTEDILAMITHMVTFIVSEERKTIGEWLRKGGTKPFYFLTQGQVEALLRGERLERE